MAREKRAWFLTQVACYYCGFPIIARYYCRFPVAWLWNCMQREEGLNILQCIHMGTNDMQNTSSGKQALHSHEHSDTQERTQSLPKKSVLCKSHTVMSKFIRTELMIMMCTLSLQTQMFKQERSPLSNMQTTWSHQIRKQPCCSYLCNMHLQSAFAWMTSILEHRK